MNQILTDIFENQGTQSLTLSNFNSLNDKLFDDYIENCHFSTIMFITICFEEWTISNTNFESCFFQNCTFYNNSILKSSIYDSQFYDCKFLNCKLTPRVEFFRSSFHNCEFSNVDFTSIFLLKCKFQNIILTKINLEATCIVDLKTENVRFYGLEFNKNKPLKFFKDEKDFPRKGCVKILNSLNFRKEILNLE